MSASTPSAATATSQTRVALTPEQRQLVVQVCGKIAHEKDPVVWEYHRAVLAELLVEIFKQPPASSGAQPS